MNQIPDYELSIIRLMLHHTIGRDVSTEEIRAALMTLVSRPQPLSQLAEAAGVPSKTLYRRLIRHGVKPAGTSPSGEGLWWPSDIAAATTVRA